MSIGINFGGGSFYFSCRRNCQRIFWKIASEQNKILLRPSRSEAEGGRGIILVVKLAQRKKNNGVFCMMTDIDPSPTSTQYEQNTRLII
jgi:hypothetical protein